MYDKNEKITLVSRERISINGYRTYQRHYDPQELVECKSKSNL